MTSNNSCHTHTHTHALTSSAKIEKEYGESLVRLAKNSLGKDEIG